MNEGLARLSSLINERQKEITSQWAAAACKLPGARHLDDPLLLDHMPQLLHELSLALVQASTVSIFEMRSAQEHGAVRFRLGFDIEQVIAEFGLLRDVIQQFAELNYVNISGEVNRTVNRVIDKAIASSLKTYVQQQTDEVERKRQEHLSFIVHDLKTPISAMATATHVLGEVLKELQPPAVTNKMLEILGRNATELSNRVLKIINEETHLQALSAETAEIRLDFREIDLWPIVETLKNDRQLLASSRGNTIRNEVPQDLRLCADSELLMELLKNLLSNALKYTDNGEVIFGATRQPNSTICWVRDTGMGIAPERINHIFDKRVGDSKVPDSTGLGLNIVAKVMQLHGGKVHVESTPGAGSTFRMEFFKARCKE